MSISEVAREVLQQDDEPKTVIGWLYKDMATWNDKQLSVTQGGVRRFVAIPHIEDQRIVLRFMRERLKEYEASVLKGAAPVANDAPSAGPAL